LVLPDGSGAGGGTATKNGRKAPQPVAFAKNGRLSPFGTSFKEAGW